MGIIIFILIIFLAVLVFLFSLLKRKKINKIQFWIALIGWIICMYFFGTTPIYKEEVGNYIATPNQDLYLEYSYKLIPVIVFSLLLIILTRSKRNNMLH